MTLRATVVLASLIFLSGPTWAFTLGTTDPDTKGFQTRTLTFNLNPSNCPSDIRTLVEKAMDIWNSVSTSSLKLELGSDTTTPASALVSLSYPETAVITCSTNFAADSGGTTSSFGVGFASPITKPHILQKAGLILNVQTGTEGDITRAGLSNVRRLQTVAHELGHAIGIGHSDQSKALMYYTNTGRTSADLHQDDVDAITYLYPRDELGADGIMGCGLVQAPPPPPQNLMLMLLCLMLPLLAYIGLKRRLEPVRL